MTVVNRVIFGEGPNGDFAIGNSATFDLRFQPKVLDVNLVSAVEAMLDMEGDLVAGSPGAVADALVTMTNQVYVNKRPTRIRVEIDGVVKWDFQPSALLVGPFITLIETVPSPGNAAGHWRYRLQAGLRAPGSQGELVSDVQTSLSVVTVNGVVTRKIWRASAKGKTVSEALNKVKTFKPTEEKVTEEIERYFSENRATGTWTWDARRTEQIHRIDEKVRITGGGEDYVTDPQAGKTTMPVLFLARQAEWNINIEGTIFGYDKALVAPEPHFTAGATMKRRTRLETQGECLPVSGREREGLYQLAYMEVWVSTAAKVPTINHHGHDALKFIDPPADGAMAS